MRGYVVDKVKVRFPEGSWSEGICGCVEIWLVVGGGRAEGCEAIRSCGRGWALDGEELWREEEIFRAGECWSWRTPTKNGAPIHHQN